MSAKFCSSCGAPRQQGVRFCGGCGAAHNGGTPAIAGAMPEPAMAAAPVPASGWHVAVGDQLPTFAPVATPPGATTTPTSAAAATPQGASIRGSVMQLLMVTGTDWVAAYATGDPAATKLADLRAGLAVIAAIAGMISGRSRGFFSKITMLSSLGLAVAQSPSLVDFGQRIVDNPALLGPLLPNVATQGLSFMAAIRTALAARK